MTSYEEIARKAEADLNTYQSKTGAARPQGIDENTGINTYAEKKFENNGAAIEAGDELSTNASYNKRIPPSEGGILDDRGRQARGKHYEGEGGPLDKLNQESGAYDDNDVVPARIPKTEGLGSVNDIATKGKQASISNVGTNPSGPGGSQFKGEQYYQPETVPGSISAEGLEAPESVIQASRETEGYGN